MKEATSKEEGIEDVAVKSKSVNEKKRGKNLPAKKKAQRMLL